MSPTVPPSSPAMALPTLMEAAKPQLAEIKLKKKVS
jgi:hypothetical protein